MKPVLLLLLLIAAAARFAPLRCLSDDGGLRLADPDTFYHLRMVRWSAENFPSLLSHDTYLSHPNGEATPWPGLFDAILSFFVVISRWLGFDGPRSLELTALAIIPLLGTAVVWLALSFARAAANPAAGWIAGGLVALAPALVGVSRFGIVDHHVLEGAVLLAGLHPAWTPRVRGAILGLSLSISQSMLLPVGIAALSAFLAPKVARPMARAALLWGAPLFAALSVQRGFTFDYRSVSLVQPTLLAGWFLVSHAAFAPGSRWRIPSAGAALALAAALAFPLVQGGAFLTSGEIRSVIADARPLHALGSFTLTYLTWNLLLWPLALAGLTVWAFRHRFQAGSPARLPCLSAFLLSAGAALFQVRFAPLLALSLTVSLGMAAGLLAARIDTPTRRRWATAGIAAWIALSPGPFLRESFRATCNWTATEQARAEILAWLRVSTPDPGTRGDPRWAPSYRVLAPWHWGYQIVSEAQRAVIVNNFILSRESPGLEDSVRFYFLDSPTEAVERARRLNVRYVVAIDFRARDVVALTRLYDPAAAGVYDRELTGSRRPGTNYPSTMAWRLLNEPAVTTPEGSLRLVAGRGWNDAGGREEIRVFEVAP